MRAPDDTDARLAFAERLRQLSLHMYNAMSQGADGRIAVNPEMAEDVLAASEVIKRLKTKEQ